MIFEDSMAIHSGGGLHLMTHFLQVGGSSLDALIQYCKYFFDIEYQPRIEKRYLLHWKGTPGKWWIATRIG